MRAGPGATVKARRFRDRFSRFQRCWPEWPQGKKRCARGQARAANRACSLCKKPAFAPLGFERKIGFPRFVHSDRPSPAAASPFRRRHAQTPHRRSTRNQSANRHRLPPSTAPDCSRSAQTPLPRRNWSANRHHLPPPPSRRTQHRAASLRRRLRHALLAPPRPLTASAMPPPLPHAAPRTTPPPRIKGKVRLWSLLPTKSSLGVLAPCLAAAAAADHRASSVREPAAATGARTDSASRKPTQRLRLPQPPSRRTLRPSATSFATLDFLAFLPPLQCCRRRMPQRALPRRRRRRGSKEVGPGAGRRQRRPRRVLALGADLVVTARGENQHFELGESVSSGATNENGPKQGQRL